MPGGGKVWNAPVEEMTQAAKRVVDFEGIMVCVARMIFFVR